ncbi:MAG: hypothetical protein V3W08_07850 [Candidatus Binatia bacterium]
MKIGIDTLLSLVMALVFGGAIFLAKDWPMDARIFPLLIGIIGALLAITALITQFTIGSANALIRTDRVHVERELTTFGWILGFFVSVGLVGFQWGLPAAILVYLKFEGKVGFLLSIVYSAVCWGFLYAASGFLHLPLYGGLIFGRWL